MPEVEKGIPCPYKNHPKSYKRKPSMWDEYLRKLEPGDSFLIEEQEVQNLQHIARQRQILLTLRRGPDEAMKIWKGMARVWIVPEEQPEPETTKPEKPSPASPSPEPERSSTQWVEDVSLL